MGQTFAVTMNQMAVFFIFMGAGYILKKAGLLPDQSGAALSKLELYIFLPALCFNTFSQNLRPEKLADKLPFIGWSALLLTLTFTLSIPLSRLFTRDKFTRAVYSYAFTIPNLGYLGYPLVQAVFGEEALLDFMIFSLLYNVFIYTVGLYMLNPARVFNIKKLINPIIISIFAGAAAGLCSFEAPAFLDKALSSASSCMGPLAMLLTGFVLARSPIKEMLLDYKMYLAGAVRLLLLPAIFGGLLWLAGADRYIILIACAMLSLPMGLNNVVFPEAFGGDSKTGARSCFVSNLMSLATVPFVYMLLTYLLG